MNIYNREKKINYEAYQFDKMMENIDIIGNKYKILEQIKADQKKAVYLCCDTKQNKYIMKIKLLDFLSFDEIDIYKSLKNNPNNYINKILSIYKTSKLLIIISEYVEGQMLSKFKFNSISEEQLKNIFKYCIIALNHIHNLEIIHGDISPYNIMISKVNNHYIPIIIDFDYSKKVKNDNNETSSDDTCYIGNISNIDSLSISGTQGYISPEGQQGIITFKSDIWSLGHIFIDIISKKSYLYKILNEMINENYILRPNTIDIISYLK